MGSNFVTKGNFRWNPINENNIQANSSSLEVKKNKNSSVSKYTWISNCFQKSATSPIYTHMAFRNLMQDVPAAAWRRHRGWKHYLRHFPIVMRLNNKDFWIVIHKVEYRLKYKWNVTSLTMKRLSSTPKYKHSKKKKMLVFLSTSTIPFLFHILLSNSFWKFKSKCPIDYKNHNIAYSF